MCAALRRIRGHIKHRSKFDKASALLCKLLEDGTLSLHFRHQTFQARTSSPCAPTPAAAAAPALLDSALPKPGVCVCVFVLFRNCLTLPEYAGSGTRLLTAQCVPCEQAPGAVLCTPPARLLKASIPYGQKPLT